jgi:hypothetical protein
MSFRKTACFFNLEIENLFLHNSMFFISSVIHVHGIASRSCQNSKQKLSNPVDEPYKTRYHESNGRVF